MDNVTHLVPGKSDKELAAEHKKAIIEASKPLMVALTNSNKDGFKCQLNFGEDAFSNIVIHQMILVKNF